MMAMTPLQTKVGPKYTFKNHTFKNYTSVNYTLDTLDTLEKYICRKYTLKTHFQRINCQKVHFQNIHFGKMLHITSKIDRIGRSMCASIRFPDGQMVTSSIKAATAESMMELVTPAASFLLCRWPKLAHSYLQQVD